MTIEELLEKQQSVKVSNTFLYFITRILKPGIKKKDKVHDKYSYKVYQVDIDNDIREHLFNLTKDQLNNLIKKDLELHEYDVISEETEQLFTYSMNNKAMSFADVVNNQLKSKPPQIKNLEEIISSEELWAYCVGFSKNSSDWLYTFRKILSGKVAIDEKHSNTKNIGQKMLRTIFNTRNHKLELIEGQTVNLDKQIDCVFYEGTFYVVKKTQFEQIVGLEEEFKAQAEELILHLQSTNMIEGLEIMTLKTDEPAFLKKLVRLSKIGNHRDLNPRTIKAMQKVCKQHGYNLKVKNNKILLEDDNDIDLTIKMLADYFKRGEVSGKSYGTFSGKELSIN